MLMTMFTSMSIFCVYSIVFNPFLIIVMKSQPLTLNTTRTALLLYASVSCVLSILIYMGGGTMCLLKSAHFAGLISQRELRHGLGMLQLIKRYIMDFSIYLLGSSSANHVCTCIGRFG
jgi:hypothetical protein